MELIILYIIFVLTIILIFYARNNKNLLEKISTLAILIETLFSCLFISNVISNGSVQLDYFSLNYFSALLFGLTILIGLFSTFYAVGYLRAEHEKGTIKMQQYWQTFFFLQLFLLSMIIAITTVYPLVLWIAIEASTLSTVFIINFFHRPKDLEVSWKYLIINTTGLLLALLGTFIFSAIPEINSQLTWSVLSENISKLNPTIVKFAFVFIFIGYGTKMGIVPMHTWKPDAYNKGPIPITTLLSTVLMNLSLYAILQYRGLVNTVIDPNFTKSLFIFFGSISVLIGALSIFTQTNYKRLLAYSSIENGGLMLLSFGTGGLATLAGILHMIYHTLSKSLLFFAAGNTALKYSSSMIKDVSGMIKNLPVTSLILLSASFSMVGMPPFGIFVSEFYLLLALFGNNLFVGLITLLSLVLVFIGFTKMIFAMIFSPVTEDIKPGESNIWTIAPSIFLFLILLVSSFYLPPFIKSIIIGSVEILN